MKKWRGELVQLALLSTAFLTATPTSHSAEAIPVRRAAISPLVRDARSFLDIQDFLGLRVFLRKAYFKPITYREWYDLKTLINNYSERVGFDLVNYWNARHPKGKSNFDKTMEYADSLMLAGRFRDAFVEYQKMAGYLKRLNIFYRRYSGNSAVRERMKDVSIIYPFVLQSMARALYASGRYEEALTVYTWISPSYQRFRQVLFEKMWAAFRAGRVEIALGSVASQRSAYFSKYLSPESYLIQTYIYRRLCRNDDLAEVIGEMKQYEAALAKNRMSIWVGNDIETHVLWRLTREDKGIKSPLITPGERDRERAEIMSALNRAFQMQKPKILTDLRTAMAYAHLATVADTSNVLKPIQKLNSREELSALDLEIWPADASEEWVDEIGTHVLIGESLCNAPKT